MSEWPPKALWESKKEKRRKADAGGKAREWAGTDALTFHTHHHGPQSVRPLCPQTLLLLAAVCIGVEYGQAVNGHIFVEQLRETRTTQSFKETWDLVLVTAPASGRKARASVNKSSDKIYMACGTVCLPLEMNHTSLAKQLRGYGTVCIQAQWVSCRWDTKYYGLFALVMRYEVRSYWLF